MTTEKYELIIPNRPKILKSYRRIFILLIIFFGLIILYLKEANYFVTSNVTHEPMRDMRSLKLKNVIDDDEKLLELKNRKIFFLETHLEGVRQLKSARQACSIESAARINPDYAIYLILATNESQVVIENSKLLEVLLSYSNIHIRYLNLVDLSAGTPLKKFMSSGRLKKSSYPIEHTADALRVLLLYKYGGTYLDLDVLSTMPLKMIGSSNWACLEYDDFFNNGLLGFDLNDGKKFMAEYLDRIDKEYNPDGWRSIGPDMLTSMLLSHCNGSKFPANLGGKCGAVTVIPAPQCFLTGYAAFYKFFEEQFTDEMFGEFRRNRGYFIHIWNKMLEFSNRSYVLDYNSKSAYMEFAKVFCPRVVDTRIKF